jgi:hypothetical protein
LPMTDPTVAEIIRYHDATKHHYDRYARSAGYMDWANQPNPFRYYQDTPVIPLPLLKEDPDAGHQDLYRRSHNQPRRFTAAAIAGFLELSLGLSAWKGEGKSRWSLRMNPSSGNLHPTEAHLVLPQMDTVAGGFIITILSCMHSSRGLSFPGIFGETFKCTSAVKGF